MSDSLDEIEDRLRAVEEKHLRLTGMEERNGRIGRLEAALSAVTIAHEKRASRVLAIVAAVGTALGGSAYAVISSIADKGRDAARLDRVEQDVRELADDLKMFRAPWRFDRSTQPVDPAPTGDDR